MLDVVSKRSKIGKILDTLDVTNDDVAAACEVAPQTVSKWRNLDKNGKTHHTISYENLMRLINFMQKKSDVSYDPVDLLEAPEHYVNSLKVIGTLTKKNSRVQLYPRDRSVDVDNRFPPDRSAIEYKVNQDKIYYIVFDEMEYPPNSKVVHNCDVVFHFKKGHYIVGQDVQIGFDNKIKFKRRFTGNTDQTIKASDVKCFYIITDIKIHNSR